MEFVYVFISLSHFVGWGGDGLHWASWVALGQRQMGKDGVC